MTPDALSVYCTFKDESEAATVAKALLSDKLVACANIFAPHRSLYEWEGRLLDHKETAVLFKTLKSQYDAVEQKIRALHSYETPAIVAFEPAHIDPQFAAWISSTVQPQEKDELR